MAKRILVIYYSQTGQTLEIIQSLTRPFAGRGETEVVLETLRPVPEFPFPWNSKTFLQVMPECVQGIPCAIEPVKVQGGAPFDLVILAWQSWYLSPSLPIQAFLQSETGRSLLRGKPVVTVTGCRNMWVMALEDMKKHLAAAGAKHVGNIVLRDKAPNLVSIFSIVRWMLYGKKEKSGLIPRAGVSEQDIRRCQEYGASIRDALLQDRLPQLQAALIQQGAVEVLPGIVSLEKAGKRVFGIWSKIIRWKGPYGDPGRDFLLRIFKIYLLTGLFLVSPLTSAVFKLISWVFPKRARAVVEQYQATSC